MIKFLSVTKLYGHGREQRRVLDNVSLEIKRGEFVSVVGQSGAGKTTLIQALIGEKIDEGSITVNNFDITKAKQSELQEYRRHVGVVFQDYKLLPRKTVFENISFALEVCGYKKQDIAHLTVEAMRKTGIEEQRNQYPNELSGGERQRTAIARALVHAPEILIADEPTGNLDEENARQIVELLLKINREGTTIILASHNKEIVNQINRRVITLKRGALISDNTANPAQRGFAG
jgi:cell division transport system ATP-binding protein